MIPLPLEPLRPAVADLAQRSPFRDSPVAVHWSNRSSSFFAGCQLDPARHRWADRLTPRGRGVLLGVGDVLTDRDPMPRLEE
jgi:hypothetical protein